MCRDARSSGRAARQGHRARAASRSRVRASSWHRRRCGRRALPRPTADGSVRIGGLDPGIYALRAVQGARVSPIEVGISVGARRGEGGRAPSRAGRDDHRARRRRCGGRRHRTRSRDARRVGVSRRSRSRASPTSRGASSLGPIARGSASLSARAEGFVAKGAVRIDEPVPAEVKVALAEGRHAASVASSTRAATRSTARPFASWAPISKACPSTRIRSARRSARPISPRRSRGPRPLVPAGELGVMPGPVPAIPHGPAAGLALAGSRARRAEREERRRGGRAVGLRP